MYSVVLLMAITSGGESAEFCRGCRGCFRGCYCGCGCRIARGCRVACSCYGCYSGCYVSYCYSGCYHASVCYGCSGSHSVPVVHGCAVYSAPVSYGCVVSAPVVSGCVATVSCVGGHLISSRVIDSGTSYAGISANSNTVASGTTASTESRDIATAEDDRLTLGTPLSSEEQAQLKEMLDAEKDAAERKKIEEEFKQDSRVGRKATYEVFKKMKTNREEVKSTATIVVTLPAQAKLTIDGNATTSRSSLRQFETPALQKGYTYYYTFEAEFIQNGAPVKVSKRVTFQAGSVVRCDLTSSDAASVARR